MSGHIRPHSSQLAEPLWTDPGLNSGISMRKLISTLKKKAQAGNELSNFLKISSHARKVKDEERKEEEKPPRVRNRFACLAYC